MNAASYFIMVGIMLLTALIAALLISRSYLRYGENALKIEHKDKGVVIDPKAAQ
jgi:hypothetical protein